jgi:predicted XRE-type DNA-binding protein
VKTKSVQGVEVHLSSGNVFADLGLEDADKLKIKTGLVIEIRKAMNRLALTQQEAAKRMGITQPKVSDMMRGNFANLSERKLIDCHAPPHHHQPRHLSWQAMYSGLALSSRKCFGVVGQRHDR